MSARQRPGADTGADLFPELRHRRGFSREGGLTAEDYQAAAELRSADVPMVRLTHCPTPMPVVVSVVTGDLLGWRFERGDVCWQLTSDAPFGELPPRYREAGPFRALEASREIQVGRSTSTGRVWVYSGRALLVLAETIRCASVGAPPPGWLREE